MKRGRGEEERKDVRGMRGRQGDGVNAPWVPKGLKDFRNWG